MEYKEFAKYYDRFYSKKNYQNEVKFLEKIISDNKYIIDVGCGTGIHGSLLEKDGYIVDGLDLNEEMLNIAKTRLHGEFYCQNILNIDIDKKYDVAISMFAVINHLSNVNELEKALFNLKRIIRPNGLILLDLHNPQSSGEKVDSYSDIKRTMKWNLDKVSRIEKSEIIFEIGKSRYDDSHIFRIFSIDEVKNCCEKVGLNLIYVYENYDINKIGSQNSKNLQFLIKNEN